jgi:ATP-dependent RNA helicase RhlE
VRACERFTVTTFKDLGLAETILRAFQQEGYENPTPIQAQSIPALLAGRDLLGIAQTGTGKTAAFAAPILHRLFADGQRAQPKCVRALVLAPTRELAAQIAQSFKTYGRFMRVSVGVVVGGVSLGPQRDLLSRGVDVLVATPGRLLDHLSTGALRLDSTKIVVLDEADHMLDLGFVVPIRKILAKLPKDRQSLFFSATMPSEIAGLAGEMLNNPMRVSVTPVATTVERITQEVFLVEGSRKRDMLVELLSRPEVKRTIVFTRTKRGADRVTEHLEAAGLAAAAIHGNKSQGQRQRALDAFRNGRTPTLVATDIAARGIDVDGVTHVVNFELPDVPESYVHRIGRTARAGADGAAFSLCDHEERHLLRQIERLIRLTVPMTDRRDPSIQAKQPADAPGRGKPRQQQQHRDPRQGRGPGGAPQRQNAQQQRPSANGGQPRPQQGRPQRDGRPGQRRPQQQPGAV